MDRPCLAAVFGACALLAGCNAIAGLTGSGTDAVRVQAPTGLLVGDSAHARVVARRKGDSLFQGVNDASWKSSAPAVVSVNSAGLMRALAVGHATISGTFQGVTGSVVVTVGSDDSRFAYALADQPSAAGPYAPDPSYRFSSTGGAISLTRASTGVYAVTFSGLGRPAGGSENVQVTAYGGTTAIYCKPIDWSAAGSDLTVPVNCFLQNGVPADSKFVILVVGSHAFGAASPLAFVFSSGDSSNVVLDTSATARNSAGGHITVNHASEGLYQVQFDGMGAASGGSAGPVGTLVTAAGSGPRRCHTAFYDLAQGITVVGCQRPGSAVGDAPFSFLWLTRGRPGKRYAYAWSNTYTNAAYQPPSTNSASSGGAITVHKTATGVYDVTFAGLARPAGATEIVLVSVHAALGAFCAVGSWSSVGADLIATVRCYSPAPAPVDALFNILVLE